MRRIAVLALGLSIISTAFAARDVNELFMKSCNACHSKPVAATMKSPEAFNPKAWEPRLKKGMPELIKSVTNGLNNMPPRGLCMDCKAEEYEALINYMSTAKK